MVSQESVSAIISALEKSLNENVDRKISMEIAGTLELFGKDIRDMKRDIADLKKEQTDQKERNAPVIQFFNNANLFVSWNWRLWAWGIGIIVGSASLIYAISAITMTLKAGLKHWLDL